MGAETKITITLPTKLVAELEASVAAGEHVSLDAAIRAALEDFEATRLYPPMDPERVRAFVQEGIDSGPGLDGEEVFAELIQKYDSMPDPKR